MGARFGCGHQDQLLAQTGRHAEALAVADLARDQLEVFGAEDDLYEIGWTVGLCAAATGAVDQARTIAADLANQPVANRGGPDGDAAQIAVLATRSVPSARGAPGTSRPLPPRTRVRGTTCCRAAASHRTGS